MKRVRVSPGRYVVVSAGLAEKADRVGSTVLTLDQIRDLVASEPKRATGVMLGGTKPLALSRAKARRCGRGPHNASQAREDST